MSKYAEHTLTSFVSAIRELEQQANAARKQRDRKLDEARKEAQKVSDHVTQAANLRQILGEIDDEFYAKHFGEVFDEHAGPKRDQLIAGYRDGLAFLEATPQVPFTNQYLHLNFPKDGTNEQRRAMIERAAELMGVQAKLSSNYRGRPEYGVQREFGPVLLYGDVDLDPEDAPEPAEAEITADGDGA